MSDLAEQHDMWLALKMADQKALDKIANPVVRKYGPDPQGRKCKDCDHLYAQEYSKRYYKCELRGKPTKGPGTDHRVNWPACVKFKESTA